ncbi:MAG TPA: GtrA family protein [Thermomicrobiales bacterium]|nr:GtrA family protein [Thermomicrobiales bacterium]
MMSTESWPQPAIRLWTLAQRFQKFIVVGSVGLIVNQLVLWGLRGGLGVSLHVASPVAIFVSMIVTFILNEFWTWHDRGSGRIISRVALYFPINSGGLLINYLVLAFLVSHSGMHYLVANLIGAGIAAIWNFALNNTITWRN